MSSVQILHQVQLFGQAVLFGCCMLLVYDLIRIFRRVAAHGVVWIAVEDMFFWVLSAFVLFQFLYQERHIPSGVEFHQPGQSGIRRQKSQEPNPCPEIGARLYPTTNVVFHIKTSISWCRGEGR